jgi:hypothetical protein
LPNAMRLIAGRLPRVTPDEVRRFVGTVEVRDAEAFAAELEVFMQEWLQRVELPASLEMALSRQAVEHALVVHPGGHPNCPTCGHPNCSTLATVT